ncbi:MAG TPA: chromosome segregation protein SMC [Virgibacillus sp.]|nr:chromosome segregation protein SMC [Virgibacillus sp.]
MYLKRLESVGFKSFADRINISFVPGVTAIVGPNGSGKSNITDAIRWVLGEQSVKSLRGSKMEDIIFQGSDTRRPLNFAEVVLVLDNSEQTLSLDYDEVSITRRVYRSGDSEFYINKQACRLKDIIDLFMDSGLGKEAFSIISQGKVEEVLSSKAEERRTIFEEAAGVLKYKQRKGKAEHKLTETKDNLSRIDDIVYEIEQQIEPLSEQAAIATTYVEKKEQLKQFEISYLIAEIEQLHGRWTQILASLEKENQNELELKTTIQVKEAQIENRRDEVAELDTLVETLQRNLLKNTQQLEQLDGRKQVLHERTKHFSENKQKLEEQAKDADLQRTQLAGSLTKETEQLQSLQHSRRETKVRIEELEEKLRTDKADILEQIEDDKADYIEYLNKQAANRNEQQSINQQLKQLALKNTAEFKQYSELKQLQKKVTDKKQRVLKDYSLQETIMTEKETEVRDLKVSLVEERNQFNSLQENLYKGFEKIAKLKSRRDMLVEMKEDFQGFFYGVKTILKAREKNVLQGIHGAVIELIDVPKPYVTAIETALGGQAQHVVVDDDQQARAAISWLKQTNNGRATFLPLSSISARYLSDVFRTKIEEHAGYVGIAAKLVKTDPHYEHIVHHLMGNIIIAKTLKDANEIAVIVNRRSRIVTLDGDVVHPGGSISGGAKQKSKSTLFSREKELEEITSQVVDDEGKAKELEQRVKKQEQYIIQIETKIKANEEALDREQEKFQNLQTTVRNSEMELKSLNNSMLLHDQNKRQYEDDEIRLTKRAEELRSELSSLEKQVETVQEQINELTKQEKDYTSYREQLQTDLHQYQVSFAEQDERVKNQREKTNRIQTELDEWMAQAETYRADLAELLSLQEVEENESDLAVQIEEKRRQIDQLTEQIQAERKKRLDDTQLMQDQERELKEENKKHHYIIQQIQQAEVKAARLDADLENRLLHLQEEYMMTFEHAQQTYEKSINMEETKKQVAELKHTITELGTVNLGSIDEYKRISDRYEFLTVQREDLVEAKETLYSIIAKMDEIMKTRFEETFTRIKEEFTIVFKELFDGGHAELTLTDPQNILDTGIEIIAQPPGKKLQHLGLLSGGERALTAIALLFSILRVRPVPFCVLDEVEAALDEANVIRFAEYVKQHSDDTQFIVITHRKGTMEEADVLYGITMQESGVSRLVSVKLEDTQELVNL